MQIIGKINDDIVILQAERTEPALEELSTHRLLRKRMEGTMNNIKCEHTMEFTMETNAEGIEQLKKLLTPEHLRTDVTFILKRRTWIQWIFRFPKTFLGLYRTGIKIGAWDRLKMAFTSSMLSLPFKQVDRVVLRNVMLEHSDNDTFQNEGNQS